ncbi:MAG: alpha/beta fold hydrolase [Candidatus Cloacimonadota bacterium]|nr:alpha/beta fold hydrolase [Candidatus Cloacimonadota bacterium]
MDLSKYHQPFSNTTESEIGVLVIHGLTSTTSSMKYLAEQFADTDYNVELPKLSGHGTKWQDMNSTKYTDWVDDIEKALKKLQERCSKIFLCGLSLGGELALYLTGRHPEIAGIILINHTSKFTNPKFWFVPLLTKFIRSVPAIASDIKDPNSKEIAYNRTSTNGINEMLKLMKEVNKMQSNILQPCLIFKSKEDHAVPKISATFTMKKLGSKDKELIWLENSYHVAPLDYDKELIAKKSIEFIMNHL